MGTRVSFLLVALFCSIWFCCLSDAYTISVQLNQSYNYSYATASYESTNVEDESLATPSAVAQVQAGPCYAEAESSYSASASNTIVGSDEVSDFEFTMSGVLDLENDGAECSRGQCWTESVYDIMIASDDPTKQFVDSTIHVDADVYGWMAGQNDWDRELKLYKKVGGNWEMVWCWCYINGYPSQQAYRWELGAEYQLYGRTGDNYVQNYYAQWGFDVGVEAAMHFQLTESLLPAETSIFIDPDGQGAATRSTSEGTGLDFFIRVVDQENDNLYDWVSDYDVEVQYPGGGDWQPMDFESAAGPKSAYFERVDSHASPPGGDYTFRVARKTGDGNVATLIDTISGPILDPPDEDSFRPSMKNPVNENIHAVFDNIKIDGVLYDDFTGIADIGGLDGDKWGTVNCPDAAVANEALEFDIGDKVGMYDCSVPVADPGAKTSIEADIAVLAASSKPDARISWTAFNIEGRDVIAGISVDSGVARCWVAERVNHSDFMSLNFLKKEDIKSVGVGQTVTASISWDGAKLVFTADGVAKTYAPSGTPVAPDNPSMTVGARINLWLDTTTPTFAWDPVPGASTYRVRIYNHYLTKTIWKGDVGARGSFTLPPGILYPNGIYRYKIDAYDNHFSEETDHYSRSPANSYQNYLFFAGDREPAKPYIEMETGDTGVCTISQDNADPYLRFWVRVDDAQGVPDDIKRVWVEHPDGVVETTLYHDSFDSDNTATRGVYRNDSYAPVSTGTYTFHVEDREGNTFQKSEELTASPLDVPSNLSPGNNSVIGDTAVDFDWDPVDGAAFYRVEILDKDYSVVEKLFATEDQYCLPSSLLEKNALYRYRVRAFDMFFEDNFDNGSCHPAGGRIYHTFQTTAVQAGNADGPSLDFSGYGEPETPVGGAYVVHFEKGLSSTSEYWLVFEVRVADPDGVPGNISSVSVTYPEGAKTMDLRMGEQIGDTEATYWWYEIFANDSSIPKGVYTFDATDHDGNSAVAATDELAVASLAVPGGINVMDGGTVYGTEPVIEWDDVSGAQCYRVIIYDGWGGTLHQSGLLSASEYEAPPGVLEMFKPYRYRIEAFRENAADPVSPEDADNLSASTYAHYNRWFLASDLIYVDPTANECSGKIPCMSDICSAILKAESSATIEIVGGRTYTGNIDVDNGKSLTINGAFDQSMAADPTLFATIDGVVNIVSGSVAFRNIIIQ